MGQELTAVEKATAVRTALRAKLDAARATLAGLDDERKAIAFAAHTEGGEAERKLTALNKKRQAAADDVAMIEVAHLEASKRLDDIEREVASAEELAILLAETNRATEIATGLPGRAARIDAALASVVAEVSAWKAELEELNFVLGVKFPNTSHLASYGTRALSAAIQFCLLKGAVEFQAPSERKKFVEIADVHRTQVMRWVEGKFPREEAAE